ncbi:MAG TPA: BTAD domain-containing putative transcriptional regulator [Streptosporangiaceae bacterium]|jgi:DNA-binding SARP family transcriptional activator
MIRVELLDRFKLTYNDTPIPLQPMQAALITALWCLGRSAETDQLADALWEVPAQGRRDTLRARRDQVRIHVSRTRRAVASSAGPSRDEFITTGQPNTGRTLYQLTRSIQFDADQFLALTRNGLRALALGQHHRAADVLTSALDLWGPAAHDQILAGLADRPLVEEAITRLREARRDAMAGLGKAEISIGLHRKAASDLKPLARDWPDDLEIAYLLAIALYRSGQPGTASETVRQIIVTAHDAGVDDRAFLELQKSILDGTLPNRGPLPA